MIVTARPVKRAAPRFRLSRRGWLLAGAAAVAAVPLAAALYTPLRAIAKGLAVTWMFNHGYYRQYAETNRIPTELPVGLKSWVNSVVHPSGLPPLSLDIKFRHLGQLRVQREDALQAGLLIQGEDDFVPAVIRLPDRSVDVEIRLKGDLTDQLNDDKWAFRVHVKGDDHIFGMRRFSLHHPNARDYQAEPLFLEHVRRMGVLAPRYMFARVRLNGDDLGIMALEEHFSTELLESQGRRESVILKFDDTRHWETFAATLDEDIVNPFGLYLTSEGVPFRLSRINKSPALTEDLRVATGLFRAFLDSTLAPSQVFDVKLTGRFLAVVRAWSAWHTVIWPNIRFYYNPITARFEPIAFDAELMRTPPYRLTALSRTFLRDSLIREEYTKAVHAISETIESQGDLQTLQEEQRRYLAQLHRQFPFLRPLDLTHLVSVAERPPTADTATVPSFMVRGPPAPGPAVLSRDPEEWATLPRISPDRVPPENLVIVHTITDGAQRYLELSNVAPFEVTVSAAVDRTGLADGPDAFPIGLSNGGAGMTLPGKDLAAKPTPVRIPLPDSATVDSVYVRASAMDEGAWVRPTPYYPALTARPIPAPSLAAVTRHRFLRYDAETRTVTAQPGAWDVTGTISLPEGVGLTLPAGTELRFEADAVVVVRGPTRFEGTAAAPVVLRGQGADSGSAGWGGMAVFNHGSHAEWWHVRVLGTTGVDLENWHLTGGVTIYQGRVSMSDTEFTDNRGEDALNLVHTDFALENVRVRNAISDGIDVDFGSGTMTGGEFSDIGWVGGGDAFDTSGATVRVTGTRFHRVGDKAISVGEASTVRVADITVDGAGAGAVSKDGSYLSLSGAHMANIRHAALMAYIKKAEYGGAVLEADEVSSVGPSRLTQAQIGSYLTVDGTAAATVDLNVDSLYATVMRRGLRR